MIYNVRVLYSGSVWFVETADGTYQNYNEDFATAIQQLWALLPLNPDGSAPVIILG